MTTFTINVTVPMTPVTFKRPFLPPAVASSSLELRNLPPQVLHAARGTIVTTAEFIKRTNIIFIVCNKQRNIISPLAQSHDGKTTRKRYYISVFSHHFLFRSLSSFHDSTNKTVHCARFGPKIGRYPQHSANLTRVQF